jgi:hypothetical protein
MSVGEPSLSVAGRPLARRQTSALESVLTAGVMILVLAIVAAALWLTPPSRQLGMDAAQARRRVVEIVNQPVTPLTRAGQFELFSPGWFHSGAVTPDFDTVDVRATQQLPYVGYAYVSSDLNPGQMFMSRDLEFNAMTKMFYADRSLPKHRLSEAEMLEINHLYRVIGRARRAAVARWEILGGLAAALLLLAAAPRLLSPRRD